MEIIDKKDNLVNSLNEIITNYIDLKHDYDELNDSKLKANKIALDTITKLNESLNKKDIIISKLNKDKCEYETIINNLNEKLEQLATEESDNNKHSILINQANQLEEKDRAIEHLQSKLEKYIGNKETKDHIKVFTDGSCINNGSENAKAGYGVYFGQNDIRNVSERFKGNQTSNMAELKAIIKVFDICKELLNNKKRIIIYSDSKVAIGWCTNTGEKYKNLDWKHKSMDLETINNIKEGYELFKKYPTIEIMYVKAHSKDDNILSIGNNMADKLAKDSLQLEDVDIFDIINKESENDTNEQISVVAIKNNIIEETVLESNNTNGDDTKGDDTKVDGTKVDDTKVDDIKGGTENNTDDDTDEVWIKVKYKKIAYYIVENENPQYIYTIMDNKKCDKVGYREIINKKKKYTFY